MHVERNIEAVTHRSIDLLECMLHCLSAPLREPSDDRDVRDLQWDTSPVRSPNRFGDGFARLLVQIACVSGVIAAVFPSDLAQLMHFLFRTATLDPVLQPARISDRTPIERFLK